MREFRTELADINVLENFQIEISEFTKFADFFLDGFFADLIMQEKIVDTLKNVISKQREVECVMSKLNELKVMEEELHINSNKQLSRLVTGL